MKDSKVHIDNEWPLYKEHLFIYTDCSCKQQIMWLYRSCRCSYVYIVHILVEWPSIRMGKTGLQHFSNSSPPMILEYTANCSINKNILRQEILLVKTIFSFYWWKLLYHERGQRRRAAEGHLQSGLQEGVSEHTTHQTFKQIGYRRRPHRVPPVS